MAVLGRILVSSSQRIDLPDLLSIDAYSAGDWQYFLQTLVGSNGTYVIRGFDVIDPIASIGQGSISIRVADSAVYYPQSSAGPFFYGLPAGNAQSAPLVPGLVANATNYVYLTLTTINTAEDSRAFWDPDANGGAGSEYSAPVNTQEAIAAQINVSTGSFPQGTAPIAIVVCSSNGGQPSVDSITDARNMMFRLGTGGISPDPFNDFAWPSLPNSLTARDEPSSTASAGSTLNPFQGGDKNINSLKEWMDAIMTRLKELGGTQYWYEDNATMSLMSFFIDSLASTVKSKGTWTHDPLTPGLLTWSEDIILKSTQDPRDYILRAGNVTLANEQVLSITMNRGYGFNAADQGVQWTNGSNVVAAVGGALGLFANLNVGDYVKKATDSNDKFLRVDQFYAGVAGTGTTASPALAGSIVLNAVYAGTTEVAPGTADQGEYTTTDVTNRNNTTIQAAGGDYHWLAIRSDTILNVASITYLGISGTITSATGSVVTVSATAHGLTDLDYITVTAPAGQAGTYPIDYVDPDTFTFQNTDTSTGAFTAHSAIVVTAQRTNATGNYVLENADNNFANGDIIYIAGITPSGYNAQYQKINPHSATTFNIPIPSNLGNASVVAGATATTPKVIVRTDQGQSVIVPGQVVNVSGAFATNVMLFVGMASVSQTYPSYSLPAGYNALTGQSSFNALTTDNVTERLSKLSAMMADKAQDKTIQILPINLTSIVNTTNGAAQEITFNSGASLTITRPGSTGVTTVTLPSSAPGISLLGNQTAYITINRNAATTPSITVANTATLSVDENMFVIASRITGSAVYLWDGTRYSTGQSSPFDMLVDRNITLEDGGIMSYAVSAGVGTLTFSQNLNLVLNSTVGGTPTVISLGSTSRVFNNDGDMWYVIINRATGAVVSSAVVTAAAGIPAVSTSQQIFLIAKRSDSADANLVSFGIASRVYFRNGFTMVQGQTSPMGNDKTFLSPVNFLPTNVSGAGAYDLAGQASPFIRFTSAPSALRRIAAGSAGQFLIIKNATASDFSVSNAAATGTGSQIITGTGVDLTLAANASISLIYDATSSTWNVVGGTGQQTDSGLGDDLITTLFQASFLDEFTESPANTNSAVNPTITNATYLSDKTMYQVSYDATLTASSLGTAVTMSGAPSFTVAVGDVIYQQGSPEIRRITNVASQTSYTIDSAFTSDLFPLTPVTVSQAVHTVDVYNATLGGNPLSVAFTTTFDEILVDYQDSSAVGDNVFDISLPPVVGYMGSTDNVNWSGLNLRPTLALAPTDSIVLLNAGSSLYLRFFAFKLSGSGSVNILRYKAYLQIAAPNDTVPVNCSYGYTDGSVTPVNATISVIGGKTTITLNWTYALGVQPSLPYGSIEVYLNGQLIPRYIASITTDTYYTEYGSNAIQLDQDYSSVNLSFEILKRVDVIYASSTVQNDQLAMGEKNYFLANENNANPDFESGLVSPWNPTTITLAGGLPTGAPTGSAANITFVASISNPLSGTYSGLFTKAALNSQGQGVMSGPMVIDREDTAKVLYGSFAYEVVSGTVDFSGTSTQSLEIWVYNTVSGAWTQPAGYRGMNQSVGQGKVTFSFQTDGNTANNTYRIAIFTAQTSTSAYSVRFDSFQLGPSAIVTGAVISDWVNNGPITLTGSTSNPTKGTTGVDRMLTRRVGDSLEVRIEYRQTAPSGNAGSGDYLVSLPAGLSIDLNKVTADSAIEGAQGDFTLDNGVGDAAVGNSVGQAVGTAFVHDVTRVRFGFISVSLPPGSGNDLGVWGSTYAATTAANLFMVASFKVPVAGWSSNVQMSSDTDTRVVAAIYTGNGGQVLTASVTNITWSTVSQDTHGAWNGTEFTCPVSGYYQINGCVRLTTQVQTDIQAHVDGVVRSQLNGNRDTAEIHSINGLVFCNAGQKISFRSTTGATLSNASAINHCIQINRLSGPSVIAANETVACTYTGTATGTLTTGGTNFLATIPTKLFDTHNSYSSGLFTVPVSGKYQVTAQLHINATYVGGITTARCEIRQAGSASTAIIGSQNWPSGAFTNPTRPNASIILNCIAGDTIGIYGGSDGSSLSYGNQCSVSIVRVGN